MKGIAKLENTGNPDGQTDALVNIQGLKLFGNISPFLIESGLLQSCD